MPRSGGLTKQGSPTIPDLLSRKSCWFVAGITYKRLRKGAAELDRDDSAIS